MARLLISLLSTALLIVPPVLPAATVKKTTKTRTTNRERVATRPAKDSEDDNSDDPNPAVNPNNIAGLAPGELPLAAKGAIVIDGDSARTLYEKNADEPEYPASTTKIMTALLVIEAGDLEKEVEITDEDSKVGESSLEVKPGQRFTRRQMLYGLMLKSANDVAHALGRDNAGTAEEFAQKMTTRARELGATSTSFRNPHGLHHLEHYTTPRDLALIARAAMQQPLFRQIVATMDHPWVTELSVVQLRNHNRLLWKFPGCIGVKTGYTVPAQQCLASAADRDGKEVIAVVMHTNKPGIWEDSKLLLSYGFDHVSPPFSNLP